MFRPRPLLFGVALLALACGTPPGLSEEDGGELVPLAPDSGGGAQDAGAAGLNRIVSLTLSPASLPLRTGGVSGVSAHALFEDGSTRDVSGTVTWSAQPNGVVGVTVVSAADNQLKVEGLAPGTATLTARTGSIVSSECVVTVSALPSPDAGSPLKEVRAVWVTRFAYSTAAEVRAVIDRAAGSGFNVVYFQIRGNGDAYYRSSLVPWAKKLSGTLGKDPGWDPLQVAIDQAHLHGIELHAYWNVFSAWPAPAGCASAGTCTCQPTQGLSDSCALPEASPPGMPEHFLRTHPQTMAVNGNGKSADTEYYWFSPGNPQVRAHLVAVATELLSSYAVDGLHFDRVRYPGQAYSWDAVSRAAYAALPAGKPSYSDWQREQVNQTVAQLYQALQQTRPKAVLSAAVWGIYKPLPGCSTSQGFGNYYQDSIAWMKAGQIDALTPMIYWDLGSGCTDFAKHLEVFLVGSNGRQVVAGMHALDNAVPQPAKLAARIEHARRVGAAGTAIFASTYLDNPPLGGPSGSNTWSTFRADAGPYLQDAGTPPITWR